MTDSQKPAVPGPRHAVPREGVRSRLRGRALAIAAVPTALLMGAAYTPTMAAAADPLPGSCASSPDTVLKETPVPKSEIKVQPDSSTGQAAAGQSGQSGQSGQAPAEQSGQAPAEQSGQSGQSGQAPAGSAAAVPAVFTGSTGVQSAAYVTPNDASAGGGVQQAGIVDDWWDKLTHPSSSPSATPNAGTPAPATTPSPSASSKPSDSPSPSATGRPTTEAPATPEAPAADGTEAPTTKAPTTKSPTTKAPAPSASASDDPNCLVSTKGLAAKAAPKGHVVPDQNWVLHSTRLALHGSVFNGVYDVTTESGTKRVLKFTTDSVDIENLDMSTIQIPGLTFHVKSRQGSTSTMRNGPITMYVESLSGHLAAVYGLPIPIDLGEITLTPDTLPKWLWDLLGAVPIPLDLTLTGAKAVQAGQFGGDLNIPGMRLFNDKEPYDG
ncbi:hypothetical protein [Kitasatospora sp. CB01950]|uniref:hypothetical protein n=1 Tax=Kitasatospora sp. CB01950 TaxID=1703930 RepID=UPI00093F809B|nr:hypothetical protein [Kitasatospora sp. CB01950]OKJ07434.1 hypothetical protein AMK19_21095 [Kitasatospora sp. CB01950]